MAQNSWDQEELVLKTGADGDLFPSINLVIHVELCLLKLERHCAACGLTVPLACAPPQVRLKDRKGTEARAGPAAGSELHHSLLSPRRPSACLHTTPAITNRKSHSVGFYGGASKATWSLPLLPVEATSILYGHWFLSWRLHF